MRGHWLRATQPLYRISPYPLALAIPVDRVLVLVRTRLSAEVLAAILLGLAISPNGRGWFSADTVSWVARIGDWQPRAREITT